MSEENKNLEEKANEAFENAKENAKETFEDAKEATKEFAEDAKEKIEDFAEEAKSTVNEFTENLNQATSNGENKKVLAGILAIFFGTLGIHKFILGYQKEGIILLGITLGSYLLMCVGIGFLLVFVPWIIGLIEGIIYLTKSDEEFYQTYQVNKKAWF